MLFEPSRKTDRRSEQHHIQQLYLEECVDNISFFDLVESSICANRCKLLSSFIPRFRDLNKRSVRLQNNKKYQLELLSCSHLVFRSSRNNEVFNCKLRRHAVAIKCQYSSVIIFLRIDPIGSDSNPPSVKLSLRMRRVVCAV